MGPPCRTRLSYATSVHTPPMHVGTRVKTQLETTLPSSRQRNHPMHPLFVAPTCPAFRHFTAMVVTVTRTGTAGPISKQHSLPFSCSRSRSACIYWNADSFGAAQSGTGISLLPVLRYRFSLRAGFSYRITADACCREFFFSSETGR